MKAVVIKEFGGVEGLVVNEVADPPQPTGSEVLVRVRSAGLNRADILQRKGSYAPPDGIDPKRPGLEFAGEVNSVGPDARRFAVGDKVFGISAGEAQAELLLTDESLLAVVPENLSLVEAGGIPEVFVTANDAIFDQGELKARRDFTYPRCRLRRWAGCTADRESCGLYSYRYFTDCR